MRTRLIKLVTFLGGIYFFLEFVLPGTVFGVKIDTYHDQISNGFITVGAMAAGLGLINLLMQHGSKIIFRRREWVYSAALLSGLAIMIAVTWQDWSGNPPDRGGGGGDLPAVGFRRAHPLGSRDEG